MKIPIIAIVLLAIGGIGLQAQTPTTATTQDNVPAPTDYQIVQQDANSRVWQQDVYEQEPNGQIIARPHQYTELATGLNHLVNGQFVPSTEEIDILPDGTAAATNGQHQVFWPADILGGEIQLVTADGKLIKSQPVGLGYDDGSNTVLIAVLTNSIGQLAGPNQVIYTNAFNGVNADLLYTYTKAGFEQDVILREQPPTPASVYLNPDTTRLQVLTEFFDPPQPAETTSTLPEQAGLALTDDTLDFGTMQMISGKAFKLGEGSPLARVGKSWVTLQGRQFLVEAVPVAALAEQLDALPAPAAQTASRAKAPTVSRNLALPPQHLAKAGVQPLKLAGIGISRKPGVVLDYLAVNSSLTNYTFRGDTTYYISGTTYSYGTNTFEGGAVLKYATNSSIVIGYGSGGGRNPEIIWQGSAYRPVIFTAKDDNTVGDKISGSTGSPSGYYANPALEIEPDGAANISGFRFAYAQEALYLYEGDYLYSVENGQFVNCACGVNPAFVSANLENVLFENVQTDFFNAEYSTINVQNSTFSSNLYLTTVSFAYQTFIPTFTNCIFVDIANLTNNISGSDLTYGVSGSHNGFYYYSPLFGSSSVFSPYYPFQTVGGGGCYLTNGCYFLNVGTTNIDPVLLADLATKTTSPPLVYSNMVVSTNLILGPQAGRDNSGNPDLGYHYDPIDYIVDKLAITNATLTLTNGVAIATYNEAGIELRDNSSIVSIGNPLYPNWCVRYSSVQEVPVSLGGVTNYNGVTVLPSYLSAKPNGQYQFTKFACPAGGGDHLYDYNTASYSNLLVQECEFWSGANDYGGTNGSVMDFRNNLYARSIINASGSGALAFTNNSVWGTAAVWLNPSSGVTWSAVNNDFDSSTITNSVLTNGYNAYLNCSGYLAPTNSTDLFATNGLKYQTSYFGTFYQPTNSPLIGEGSTAANLVGLYYFTTQTNQTLDADSRVDIGYHYVATDQYGNPLATFGDEIPDYLDDPNGNGLPNWWELEYFGNTDESATNIDAQGNTFLHDFTNHLDPNTIAFGLSVTNNYVNSSNVPVQVDLLAGIPSYYAVLLNNTNETGAVWQDYTRTNIVVELGSTNGNYNVWIGLKGFATNAPQTWDIGTLPLTLETLPPVITVTNPTTSTVTQDVIQVQGYANEGLSSLTFDVSNATGIFTNQTGFLTGQFYDTNLLAYTTNYFDCDNVALNSGSNLITLHATDWAGNTTNISRLLDYVPDTNPPTINLIWPQAGTSISGSNFTVQAEVNEPAATVAATVNGTRVPGLVEQSGMAWVQNLLLMAGTNMVTLTASNSFGGVSTTNFNVTDNDVGLVIDPLPGNELNQASVSVTGSVGNTNDAVIVNGVAAYFTDGNGDWEADSVAVNPTGTASLNVQVNDATGNPLTSQNTYQPQPPTVELMSYSGRINDAWQVIGEGYSVGVIDSGTENSVISWSSSAGGSYHEHNTIISSDPATPPVQDYGQNLSPATNGIGAITPPWENAQTGYNWSDSDGDTKSGNITITTHTMIQSSGQQATGQTNVYLVEACASEVSDPSRDGSVETFDNLIGGAPWWYGNEPLSPTSLQIQGQTLINTEKTNTDGSFWGETVISAPSGMNTDITPMSLDGVKDYTFYEQATNVTLQILDANNGNANLSSQTNTVIVGQQMNLTCQLSITNSFMTNFTLTNFQWTVPEDALTNYYMDPQYYSTNAYTIPLTATNSQSISYFWVTGVTNQSEATNRIVQCSATINGKVIIGQAVFQVLKPFAHIIATTSSLQIGNDQAGDPGLCFGTNGGPPGILFSNFLIMPAGTNYNYGNTQPSIDWWQTISPPYEAGVYVQDGADTVPIIKEDTNTVVLDTTSPYGFNHTLPWPDTDDSPSATTSFTNQTGVIINQHSTMWLMFQPAGGQWVPLRSVSWYCSGSATNFGGGWIITSSSWSTNPPDVDAGTNYPAWTNNIYFY